MVFPRAAKPVRVTNVRLSLQKPPTTTTSILGAKNFSKGGKKGLRTAPTFAAPVRKTLQFQPIKVAPQVFSNIRLNPKGMKGSMKGSTAQSITKGKGAGKGKMTAPATLTAPRTLFTPKPVRVATVPIRTVKRTTLVKPLGVRQPLLKQNILNPAKKIMLSRPTVAKGLKAPLTPAFLKPVGLKKGGPVSTTLKGNGVVAKGKGVVAQSKGVAAKGKGVAPNTVPPMAKIVTKTLSKGSVKGKGTAPISKGAGKKGLAVTSAFKPLTLIKPQFKPLTLSKPSLSQKSGKGKGKSGKGKGKKL